MTLKEKIERALLDKAVVTAEGVVLDDAISTLVNIAKNEYKRGREAA
jgi:hypothetical protein